MNPILYEFIRRQVNRTEKEKGSSYRQAKAIKNYRIAFAENTKDFFLVIIGVLSAGFGLKSFLLPNDFFDGGAMGIALILDKLTPLKLPYLVVLVNLPFILIGYKTIRTADGIRWVSAIASTRPTTTVAILSVSYSVTS